MSIDHNRWVTRCCQLGMFIQAMVINLTPLLFIPLKEQLGLSYEQVGRLVLVNFLTQMAVDLICTVLADRVNVKPLTVAANLLAGLGLFLFALTPARMDEPYHGLMLGTVVFSIGCGLLEVLLSPIINAVPATHKASQMALMHAFYPIGKVVVIVMTALALHVFGTEQWPRVMLAWTVFPLLNTVGFLLVRLPPISPPEHREPLRALVRQPAYLYVLAAMMMAGATELTIAQWTSAFAEKGLGCSKLVADLLGFCLFGVGMIVGRLWFGLRGERHDLRRLMVRGAALSALMYLVISLAPWPALALVACAPAGLFVSMLWPGTLSLAAARHTRAGASMFALLAAAGDGGAAFMPWAVGIIADAAGRAAPALQAAWGMALAPDAFGLRAGLFVATLCPLLMALILRRH